MESREEIESMRVIDLREFLRRHGYQMKHITRPNGTPGPMRKAELLAAALEVHDEHRKGKPSPSRASSASRTSPTNPFQSGLPTPPDKRQRETPPSTPDDQPDDQPAASSVEQEPKPKPRRRSSAWIDPVLLAQMRATTPTKTKDSPSRARPIAPRPLFETAQDPPSRALPEPSPIRPPQRIVRRPSSEKKPTRPAQRAPGRVVAPSRRQSAVNRLPLTPRRLALRKQEPDPPAQDLDQFSQIDVKQVMDIPPPPAPTRRQAKSSAPATAEDRWRAFDFDDDYVSEEDPDYDADAEEADIDDLDNTYFDDDVEYNERDALSSFPKQYDDLRYDTVPPLPQEPIDVDAEIQEDIPIDSDHYQRESASGSDGGSTFETDDEQGRNFGDWSTADVRAWLRDHSVRFRATALRDELISVARAHALHLEATAPVSRQDEDPRLTAEDEDVIVPNRRRTSDNMRRRRVITAPTPDDESDLMEIEPQYDLPDERRTSKPTRKDFVYDRKPTRVEPRRRRPPFVLIPLIALLVFICSSGFVAMSMLQKHLTMKYCDTNATSTLLDSGLECRRCPRNGDCVDGVLFCDPGFIELRGRCVEDKEFHVLSEKLAYSASELLSKLAGRAECGEDIPRAVSHEELGNAMLTLYSRHKHAHDQQKFEDAMAKAIVTLQTDDTFGVNVHDDGYLSSSKPRFSLACRLRRKLLEYKRGIIAMILMFLLIIYFRVKRYLRMVKERRLDEAHSNALEYLRDQVNAFRNNEEDVAFVPDVVLREEVVGRPTTENKKFWKEVEERLNRDARVMRKHQVLKGMPSYTFEYVGSRRSSGRRSSGNFFETSSRRSSFGSRTSLDSFDLGPDPSGNGAERNSFIGLVARIFTQRTD